jgi:hypothetical protein
MPNQIDALIPERWNEAGLAIFYNKLVFAHRVLVQFEDQAAEKGDVVNFHRVNKRGARRLTNGGSIVIDPLEAEKIPVPLNQHYYDAFKITQRQRTVAFDKVVEEFLVPSIEGIATGFESSLCFLAISKFIGNTVGQLGGLDKTNAKDRMLALEEYFDNIEAPYPRTCGISARTKAILTGVDMFVTANTLGDGGYAMKTAELGQKFGIDYVRGSLIPSIKLTDTAYQQLQVDANDYAVGATVISVTTTPTGINPGDFITFETSSRPYIIQSISGSDITLASPLQDQVDAGSEALAFGGCEVSGDYAAGYAEFINIANAAKPPVRGQFFNVGGIVYCVSRVVGNSVMLDRPLDTDIANNASVGLGPAGDFNPAFIADAIGVVTRPIAKPLSRNVDSAVMDYKGFSMRTTIGMDINTVSDVVLIDLLMGATVLNKDYGALFLG